MAYDPIIPYTQTIIFIAGNKYKFQIITYDRQLETIYYNNKEYI